MIPWQLQRLDINLGFGFLNGTVKGGILAAPIAQPRTFARCFLKKGKFSSFERIYKLSVGSRNCTMVFVQQFRSCDRTTINFCILKNDRGITQNVAKMTEISVMT